MLRRLCALLVASGCEVQGPESLARVAWSINGSPDPAGCVTLDSCDEVDAENVRLRTLDAPRGGERADTLYPCGPSYQASIAGLDHGLYKLGLALVNVGGTALTEEIESMLDVGTQGGANACAHFSVERFLDPREGTFRFTLTWGETAQGCVEAGVATIRIDGAEQPCTDEEQTLSERVWGAATLAVFGLAETGEDLYAAECEILIGAGENPAVALRIAGGESGCQ